MQFFWTFQDFRDWARENADGPVSSYIYPTRAIDTFWNAPFWKYTLEYNPAEVD